MWKFFFSNIYFPKKILSLILKKRVLSIHRHEKNLKISMHNDTNQIIILSCHFAKNHLLEAPVLGRLADHNQKTATFSCKEISSDDYSEVEHSPEIYVQN